MTFSLPADARKRDHVTNSLNRNKRSVDETADNEGNPIMHFLFPRIHFTYAQLSFTCDSNFQGFLTLSRTFRVDGILCVTRSFHIQSDLFSKIDFQSAGKFECKSALTSVFYPPPRDFFI